MTNPRERGQARAREIYRAFHSAEPNRTFAIDVPDVPPAVAMLGEVTEIKYHVPGAAASEKGDFVYVHKFGDTGRGDTGAKPYLLAAGRDGHLLIASKPNERRFTVEERGIVG